MKKSKFLVLIFSIFFVIIVASISMSYPPANNSAAVASIVEIPIPDPLENIEPGAVWDRFIGWVKTIAPPVFGLMVAIGAILFISSEGDPNKIRTAWKVIIFSFIGLLVVFLADAIVKIIKIW